MCLPPSSAGCYFGNCHDRPWNLQTCLCHWLTVKIQSWPHRYSAAKLELQQPTSNSKKDIYEWQNGLLLDSCWPSGTVWLFIFIVQYSYTISNHSWTTDSTPSIFKQSTGSSLPVFACRRPLDRRTSACVKRVRNVSALHNHHSTWQPGNKRWWVSSWSSWCYMLVLANKVVWAAWESRF